MSRLSVAIVEAMLVEHGRAEVLRRLADPFWFQAFGAVMGMDWHSSGITTSVMGALKSGLSDRSHDLGIWVCGGRGRHSRRTPEELRAVGERTGLDGDRLASTSQLTAKVDNCAVQDGFQIYLHSFVLSADGDWAVIQQGMSADNGLARRYHWLSEHVQSFVQDPHEAIVGTPHDSDVLNLTDRRAELAREACGELAVVHSDEVLRVLRRLRESGPQLRLDDPEDRAGEPLPGGLGSLSGAPHLRLPAHHEVRASDVQLRRLHGVLHTAADRDTRDFADLLQLPGMGPRAVQSLALVSEVVYGAPSRFQDPARFAFAHGGKDGHPHPVPLHVYDETLRTLRQALDRARLGRSDRLEAFRRLDARVRAAQDQVRGGPSLEHIAEKERRRAPGYGGRTVFDDAAARRRPRAGRSNAKPPGRRATPVKDRSPGQLKLF